jgi:hypothetical protein
MGCLKGSGVPVLYIGRTAPRLKLLKKCNKCIIFFYNYILLNSVVIELRELTSGMEKRSQMKSYKKKIEFYYCRVQNTNDRFPLANRSSLCF